MSNNITAREVALKIIYKIDIEDAYSNLVVDDAMDKFELNQSDRALTTALVFGVIKNKLFLDNIIDTKSSIKPSKISPWIRNILRIGVYQLLFLDKIPSSAACNESVKLTKKYGHRAVTGFTNAILREITREMDEYKNSNQDALTSFLPRDLSENERISILYSHPKWMVDLWAKQFGIAFAEELCKINNKAPNTSIRINTLKTNREELIKKLTEINIECIESKLCRDSLIMKKGFPINELFNQGYYSVQDQAATLVCEILNPNQNEKILDVCSAPGGKTAHIAELMKNTGKIIALDIHEHRVDLVNKNAVRLGIKNIETHVADATEYIPKLEHMFDKVLVDVPCSGLGVIRRKPEIKWNRTPSQLDELIQTQKQILNNSARYVKKGGKLTYSTCTINIKENQRMVNEFLKLNSDYTVDFATLKQYDTSINESNPFLYLYPHINHTDGFFIAELIRK